MATRVGQDGDAGRVRAAPLLVVTGLAFEADLAAGPGIDVVRGYGLARLETRLEECARGCRGVLSFGVAAGLAPTLRPGDAVVGSAILSASNQRLPTEPRWRARLQQRLPAAHAGLICGVEAPLAAAAEKLALHRATGAVAADMESVAAAAVADRFGLPFAALRVILDPAGRDLPQAALLPVRGDGRADLAAILRALLRAPGDLPALVRLGAEALAARRGLFRCRRQLGEGFALVDLGEHLLDMP